MYYWPTIEDMLATLPPGERKELLDLIAAAGKPEPETADDDTP